MKQASAGFLIGALLFSGAAAAQLWVDEVDGPFARGQAAVVADLTGKIHVIAGRIGTDLETDSHDVLDPKTGIWTTAAALPASLYGVAGAVGPDGRIYVFGGYNFGTSTESGTLFIYDPGKNSWDEDHGAPAAAGWQTAGAFGADGKLYIFGGEGSFDSVLIYDPAGPGWDQGATLEVGRLGHEVFSGSDGYLYVVGGFNLNYVALASTLVYDPLSDLWLKDAGALPAATGMAAGATSSDGDGFWLVGGSSESGNQSGPRFTDVCHFLVSEHTWLCADELAAGVREAGAVVVEGRLWLLGGDVAAGYSLKSHSRACAGSDVHDPANHTFCDSLSLDLPGYWSDATP